MNRAQRRAHDCLPKKKKLRAPIFVSKEMREKYIDLIKERSPVQVFLCWVLIPEFLFTFIHAIVLACTKQRLFWVSNVIILFLYKPLRALRRSIFNFGWSMDLVETPSLWRLSVKRFGKGYTILNAKKSS